MSGLQCDQEVNVVGAENRSGCVPADVAAVVEACRALGLHTRGLMAVGPDPKIALDARSAILATAYFLANRINHGNY